MKSMDWRAYASRQEEGVSPLFSPVLGNDIQLAAAQVQGVLYRSPRLYEQPTTRWSLQSLKQVVGWLSSLSDAGVCKLLKRLHVSYKRGQRHVHSPDLRYNQKLACIRHAFALARQHPSRFVLLYQDEHVVGRNAKVARCFSSTEAHGLPAEQAARFNSMLRIAGCLDAVSGAVIAKRSSSMNVKNFLSYLRLVEEQYPQAERIDLALDNWSVHVNPAVQQDLTARGSKIHLLYLPTYARLS
jgi:hypothetical protein